MDFSDMTIHLGLFNAEELGNRIHYMLILTFLEKLFLNFFLHSYISSISIKINNEHRVVLFQVFLSNTNIYIASSNHFYLIIVNSIYMVWSN